MGTQFIITWLIWSEIILAYHSKFIIIYLSRRQFPLYHHSMQNSQNIFTKNNSKPSVNIFNNANNSASQNLNNLSQNSQNMNSQRPNNIFTSSNNPQNANIPNSNSNNTQNQLNFQKPNNPSQPLNIPPKPKDSDRSGESNIERIISFSLIYQKVMQGIALSEM